MASIDKKIEKLRKKLSKIDVSDPKYVALLDKTATKLKIDLKDLIGKINNVTQEAAHVATDATESVVKTAEKVNEIKIQL